MRITGGEFGGRPLRVPRGEAVRPTSDRVREAIFGRLGDLSQRTVLDLFAGSGALGIEALSRGAAFAVFVERSKRTADLLRSNLNGLVPTSRFRVLHTDARRALQRLARETFRADLAFLDPPYRGRDLEPLLGPLAAVLRPDAEVILESSVHFPPGPLEPFRERDERRYGDTVITRLQAPARDSNEKEDAMSEPLQSGLALFPASFDPVTYGHLNLVHRACEVFPELVVSVAHNVEKRGTFDVDERVALLEKACAGLDNVRVTAFDGLLVDYARRIGAKVVIRGLRAVADFEYEFEMALMNKHLYPDVETLFMMTDQEYLYVSSSRLKELVRFGTNIDAWVPSHVAEALQAKLGRSQS
jgi:pantetheine-phosphate adenylyltransferase